MPRKRPSTVKATPRRSTLGHPVVPITSGTSGTPSTPVSRRSPTVRPAPASSPSNSTSASTSAPTPALDIRTVPIGKLNPAPYNPRVDLQPGDPDYERLVRSLHEFGLVEPLVWNVRTGNLVGGHQRLKVLIARGDTAAQVSVVDLPLEREQALNLALNKITGGWDQGKLAALLEDLTKTPDFDIAITGFDLPEIDSILAAALGGDDRPETFDLEAELDRAAALGPPVTKPGDLILLGRDERTQHRLLCGDSTDPAQVRRLMAAHVTPNVGAGRDGRASGGLKSGPVKPMSVDAEQDVKPKPGTRASVRRATGTTEASTRAAEASTVTHEALAEAREASIEATEACTEAMRVRRLVRSEAAHAPCTTDRHDSDARGTVAAARVGGTAGTAADHPACPSLRAALFATDPPYLVGYDGTNHPGTSASKARKSLNRDWSGTYCAGADGTSWDDPDANPELYNQFVGVAISRWLQYAAPAARSRASKKVSCLAYSLASSSGGCTSIGTTVCGKGVFICR